MVDSGARARRVLLVVDDRRYVSRALARVLKYRFQQVHTAHTIAEAEIRLRDHRVTHLVCDCNMGHDQPRTIDLVPSWRRSWPAIERVVLYSGTDFTGVPIPEEVDAVVPKGADPRDLIEALDA